MKLFLIILTLTLHTHQDMTSMAAAASSMGGDTVKFPKKKMLTTHTSTKFYNVTEIPTIEMPNFESKKKVAQDNWSNLFFQDMPVEDEQMEAVNSGYPNSYVQNSPLIYPNAYATGMYPPVI